MTNRKPVALVVQRYGLEVDGGAELHCRWIAERLAQRQPVEVITTCARDYITWRNHYDPGCSILNGVPIRRFPAMEERNRSSFDALTSRLVNQPHTPADEEAWLREQGPYCPDLIRYLQDNAAHYQSFLFYTYLYYPTVKGLPTVAQHSILIPTAHDEPVIRFGIFKELFQEPRAILFLTEAERRFVHNHFDNSHIPWRLLGTGIEVASGSEQEFRTCHETTKPYLLYTGRIDAGKGCLELCDFFIRYKSQHETDLQLIFIGKLHESLPVHTDIRYLGFLSERHKAGALRGALALIASSPYESLGISALEALGVGTPIIVNGKSQVLVDHCRAGNAGLWYENADEFSAVVHELMINAQLRSKLGVQGRRYIAAHYTWTGVMAALDEALNQVE